MLKDRRASVREPLAIPIRLADGSPAMTRDISTDGLYLYVQAGAVLASWLSLEYEMPEAGLRFTAAGQVVRTEAGRDFTGVAIRLHQPRLLPLD